MFTYLIRRLLGAIPVILGVILVVFILTTIIPGDPALIMSGQRGDPETIERIREEMGLNDPLHIQLLNFYKSVLTGNLGRSYVNNMTVLEAIGQRLPYTAALAFVAMSIAIIFGILAGVISATKQYSVFDYFAMIFSLLGISAPSFFVGIVCILVFIVWLRWIPGTGTGNGGIFSIYIILPAVTLGYRLLALIARLTRSTMLEVIRQDYITTARAKGVRETIVIFKHALKNALIPVVTIVGLQTASVLGGVIVTEQIFSWPGIGRLSINAVIRRDFPVIRGVVLFMALTFVVVNILVDLSYGFLDPRIRYD
ncbi:peptide ABC transporter permease [Anoxybacter fermentans]|uniref:Peptide ABC transporter permease n=1 Tax=Anoxybacter fermentans TaxID=1323375 RepID=A0A3S9SZW2_9FIRM|nr:ABC transporter permease [Anoxybacter fermentans]AZR73702.1 peptide ABC transporter permease [Anoxybacter fermentans]